MNEVCLFGIFTCRVTAAEQNDWAKHLRSSEVYRAWKRVNARLSPAPLFSALSSFGENGEREARFAEAVALTDTWVNELNDLEIQIIALAEAWYAATVAKREVSP